MTTLTNLYPLPFRISPLNNITPFTYRDGTSFMELLESIRTYINDEYRPAFDTELNRIISEFNEGIENAENHFTETKADWETKWGDFMANVTGELAALNDVAITGLINNLESAARNALVDLIVNGLIGSDEIGNALKTVLDRNKTQLFAGPNLGIIGDGITNDLPAINAASVTADTLGLELVFDKTKTYALSGGTWTPPRNLRTNGAIFLKKDNNTTYAIKTPDNFRCDSINLNCVGGASNDAGVWVANSNTEIREINVTALTADTPGANGLFVGDTNTANTRTNIKIYSINVNGFQLPMRVRNVTKSHFANGKLNNYIVGLYVQDIIDTSFSKWEIKGQSPSATGTAGNNGVLMEATIADKSCQNVTFWMVVVENSAEHGFRIGGSLTCMDISFDRCISRKPGSKPGNLSTGGAGFKALGVLGHEHRNIRWNKCKTEDGNFSGVSGVDNHSAWNIGFVIGWEMDACVLVNNEQAISGMQGLILFASSQGVVRDCRFVNTQRQCIKIVTDNVEVYPRPGVKDIQFIGGYYDSATTSIICTLEPQMATFQNIKFTNCTFSRGGGVALRCELPTTVGESVGAYNNVVVGFEYINSPIANGVATGNPAITDPHQLVRHHYVGPVYGAFTMPGADGSTELNSVTGVTKIRKAAAWVTQ